MFEAVLAISIIVLALLFITTVVGPSSLKVAGSSSQLEVLANDVLRTLDEENSVSGKTEFRNSLLVEYIFTNNTDDFASFMNLTLPPTALYNVYVYSSLNHSSYLWYPDEANPSVGNVVKSSRVVVYRGYVYEVQLEVWYI